MYISVSDAATRFNISKRRVQILCEQGRIAGATMVSGVWLIPEAAPKPMDGRKKTSDENQLTFFGQEEKKYNIDDVCKELSISKATAKNWLRLGKIEPDIDSHLFSQEYISKFLAEIKSGENAKLKSRRNKKSATGKVLYKDYVHTPENQDIVERILEYGVVQDENDLLIILANFALQLYYQKYKVNSPRVNTLSDFLNQDKNDGYFSLVYDLIAGVDLDESSLKRLSPALSENLCYVESEDSLGFIYISLQDIGQRKSSGAYYTPERVVHNVIDCLQSNDMRLSERTICDPCCGTGNFLLGLAAKGISCSNLYGQDIDPISVKLTRINLALMDSKISAHDLGCHIITGNTFFKTFDRNFDILLGNPPWGSEFSEDDAHKCRSLFKTADGKSIESYDLFVEKGLSMLTEDGVLAFVLPESILSVSAHDTVRKLLFDSCSFKFVAYLGNAFSGVQCPSIILGVSKTDAGSIIGCKVATISDSFIIKRTRDFSDGTFCLNVSDEEYDCLTAIETIPNAAFLKGNARFALGIVTGNNKEYILSEQKQGYEVILKGSDIHRYGAIGSENYIRFTPKSFQQVAPTEVYRAKEKLLYRFICEVPVFAYDDHQTLSLNSCNIVIPEIPGINMKYVLAILNSSVAAYYISKKFNSVKLLRSHIEQMPIPVVSLDTQEVIVKKVDLLMQSSDNISGLYEELDSEITRLFGLTEQQRNVIKNALQRKNLFLRIQ